MTILCENRKLGHSLHGSKERENQSPKKIREIRSNATRDAIKSSGP